jgi:CBS domain-containing protein
MKTIKDILAKSTSHFNTINGDANVIDALALMKTENMSYVIVMDNGNYKGIMSERDYSQKVVLAGKNSHQTKVKEILSNDVPVVNIDESLDRCKELMLAFKTFYLPVFNDFSFKGVVSLQDLLHATVDELKEKEQIKRSNSAGQQQYWI